MTPVESFRGKKIALFGLGGSGIASAKALLEGGANLIVWDDNESSIEKARELAFQIEDLHNTDWGAISALILSPGVPLTHPEPHWSAKLAKEAGVEVIGDIELFCRERARIEPDSPFIAITGTNGKSTTTALIAHILKSAGRDVALGGNIGTPILALPPPNAGRFHIIEISSYQIDLAPSLNPTIGILLNISPDHLDRHGTMEEYAAVKERLIEGSKIAIIGMDDEYSMAIEKRREKSGKITLSISLEAVAQDRFTYKDNSIFVRRAGTDYKVADIANISSLRGDHNAQNAMAAIACCLELGLNKKEIQHGLQTFPGLPHRLEEIGNIGKVKFINDSKATNANSTEKALSTFKDGIFWILGGKPKVGGISSLEPYFSRITKAYLIGEASDEFAATLEGKVPLMSCETLENAIYNANIDAKNANFSDMVILFSPSCASFDQFKNFEVRGNRFRELVQALPEFQIRK